MFNILKARSDPLRGHSTPTTSKKGGAVILRTPFPHWRTSTEKQKVGCVVCVVSKIEGRIAVSLANNMYEKLKLRGPSQKLICKSVLPIACAPNVRAYMQRVFAPVPRLPQRGVRHLFYSFLNHIPNKHS